MDGCKTRHRIISRSSRQMQSVMVVRCIGFTPMRVTPQIRSLLCLAPTNTTSWSTRLRGFGIALPTRVGTHRASTKLLLVFFPDLVDDSYATIGLTGPASASGITGAVDPSLVEDESLSPGITGFFINGGTSLNVNTLLGGSWYVLNTAANSYPVDGR